MPPKSRSSRKRKAGDVSTDGGEDGDVDADVHAPVPPTRPKYTKAEKLEMRERARRDILGQDSNTSKKSKKKNKATASAATGGAVKRRKLNNDNNNNNNNNNSQRSPTATTTATATATTPPSSPPPSTRQSQQRTIQNTAANSSAASSPFTSPAKKSVKREIEEARARAKKFTEDKNAKKRAAARAAAAAARAAAAAAAAKQPFPVSSTNENNSNSNTTLVRSPPAAAMMTTHVLPQPAAAAADTRIMTVATTTNTNAGAGAGAGAGTVQRLPSTIDVTTGVSQPATTATDHSNADPPSSTTTATANTTTTTATTTTTTITNNRTRKLLSCFKYFTCFLLLSMAFLGISLWILYGSNGGWIHRPERGSFRIVGPVPLLHVDRTGMAELENYDNNNNTAAVNNDKNKPEILVVDKCYYDSPTDYLEGMSQEVLDSSIQVQCSSGIYVPCPINAICFRGTVVECRGPVWELDSSGSMDDGIGLPSATAGSAASEKACVLSKAVNETYHDIVNTVGQWCAFNLCLNYVAGATPIAYYAQNRGGDSNQVSLVVADSTFELMFSSGPVIPLYHWSTVYDKIDTPKELEDWNWDLLFTANAIHRQLILEQERFALGLTPAAYEIVKAQKLSWTCRTMLFLKYGFSWLANLFLAVVQTFFGMIWFHSKRHPLISSSVVFVICALLFWYHRKAKQARLLRSVNEILDMVYERIEYAWDVTPGPGLKKGEVSARMLGDEMAIRYCGNGPANEKCRHKFLKEIWTLVVGAIRNDSRVEEEKRVIGDKQKPHCLWKWIAGRGGDRTNRSGH